MDEKELWKVSDNPLFGMPSPPEEEEKELSLEEEIASRGSLCELAGVPKNWEEKQRPDETELRSSRDPWIAWFSCTFGWIFDLWRNFWSFMWSLCTPSFGIGIAYLIAALAMVSIAAVIGYHVFLSSDHPKRIVHPQAKELLYPAKKANERTTP